MGGSGIDMPKRMENKGSGMTRPPKDGNGNATGAVLTPEQLSCVASAVTVRESALASSFSKFSTTIMSMMSTRSSALDTAWKISDRATRRTAIDTAWKSTNDTARETRKTDDMSAIDAFKSATSTCKVGNESLDLGGLMMRE